MQGADDLTTIDIEVQSPVSDSVRARQLEAMFDVPRAEATSRSWHGALPLDEHPWSVGLIVGPSGAGKTTIADNVFGVPMALPWSQPNVVDDFAPGINLEDIASVCQAVGFNTIPAWMRPFSVLSTGERFRVELARRLLETPGDHVIVVDEFTSVVDRQVAQIGSHAVQKWVRRHGRRFVGVSCHYDIIDWLQPDWTLEPATMTFRWRSVQPRPQLDVTIGRVPYAAWQLFAPFHYLTAELNRTAACYVAFVGDEPAAFAGILHRPHPRVRNVKGCSRLVTLPDWQGLGLAFVLIDAVAGAYRALNYRMHTYPAHPALVHAFDRSALWALVKRASAANVSNRRTRGTNIGEWTQGSRPMTTFEYAGPAMDAADAHRLVDGVAEAA